MATSKVYYCSVCEDGIAYKRKEYFKHIKTEEHRDCVNYSKNLEKILTCVSADEKKQRRRPRHILTRALTNLRFLEELDAM